MRTDTDSSKTAFFFEDYLNCLEVVKAVYFASGFPCSANGLVSVICFEFVNNILNAIFILFIKRMCKNFRFRKLLLSFHQIIHKPF
jgi:hypothetical protein